MISEKAYYILKSLVEEIDDPDIQDFDTMFYLSEKEYITQFPAEQVFITDKGIEAYEEYHHFLESVDRERAILQKAEEANELSKKALKATKRSNVINGIAIFISTIVGLLQIPYTIELIKRIIALLRK